MREWGVSHAIHRLLKRKQSIDYDEATILASIKRMETELGIAYGPSQKTALIEGVQSSFFILTGGPGTGKRRSLMASSDYSQSLMSFL